MPRKRRIEFPGAIYHVTFRGNAKQDIFLTDSDRERFMDSLAKRVEIHAVRLYLYCLMNNHVHLVLETPRSNLSAFMGSLLTSYTVYFNKRHRRSGHLTQGRYHTAPVEGDEYILKLSRYVHLNPVKVHPVQEMGLDECRKRLRAYRWSSYRGYTGLDQPDPFVSHRPVLAMFGRIPEERPVQYRKFVEAGLAKTDEDWLAIMKSPDDGIGTNKFREEIRNRCEQQGDSAESFRKQLPSVPTQQVIDGVCSFYGISAVQLAESRWNDRIKPVAARLLRQFCGLKHRETAALLGVKTTAAISQMIKRSDDPPILEDIQKIINIQGLSLKVKRVGG